MHIQYYYLAHNIGLLHRYPQANQMEYRRETGVNESVIISKTRQIGRDSKFKSVHLSWTYDLSLQIRVSDCHYSGRGGILRPNLKFIRPQRSETFYSAAGPHLTYLFTYLLSVSGVTVSKLTETNGRTVQLRNMVPYREGRSLISGVTKYCVLGVPCYCYFYFLILFIIICQKSQWDDHM